MITEKTDTLWFLYLLETSKKTIYTGITTDVKRRIKEHSDSKKGAKSLRGKGPLKLMFCAQMNDQSSALKAEAWVKQQPKTVKLDIINQHKTLPFEHKILDITLLTQ